jgi:[ribosomal protein S18]-alanine N-acetyltransferase
LNEQKPHSDDISISEMSKEDLDEVMVIEKVSFAAPWSRRLFEETIEIPFSISFVARKRIDNTVIGYANFYLVGEDAQVLNIAIAPAHRARGYGKSLLSYAIGGLRERNAKDIYLEVREGNKEALSMYAMFGFRKVGRRKKYYTETNEDAIVMHLKVGHGRV